MWDKPVQYLCFLNNRWVHFRHYSKLFRKQKEVGEFVVEWVSISDTNLLIEKIYIIWESSLFISNIQRYKVPTLRCPGVKFRGFSLPMRNTQFILMQSFHSLKGAMLHNGYFKKNTWLKWLLKLLFSVEFWMHIFFCGSSTSIKGSEYFKIQENLLSFWYKQQNSVHVIPSQCQT